MIYRIALLLLPVLLCACATEPAAPASDPLRQASAVAVTLPGFVTSAGTTMRWHSDLKWAGDPQEQSAQRAQMLQQALQRELERKGYRFMAGSAEANYDIVAVALPDPLQDRRELERVFRLYPSLAEPAEGYGTGTVLVAIAPAGTRDIVWRGALEVFTDPDGMTAAQRDKRMQWAAAQLLHSIPYLP